MYNQKNSNQLNECLACGSDNLELTLNLNNQPLANSYKDTAEEVQEEFPLAINRCEDCFHIQLTTSVDPELMFKNYLYVSGTSLTMKEHFRWFNAFTTEYFSLINGCYPIQVLDIGCNDGSQLDQYKIDGIITYGVDPAENLAKISRSKGHRIFAEYFDDRFVNILQKKFDIIIAQNVFAHNYNPLFFLQNVSKIMKEQSLFFVQTSQADMILNNEFDTIYHEHINFFNINSMNKLCNRAGLNLIDVVKCPLHGNSYIFVISKTARRVANIHNMIEMERKIGLYTEETYFNYANNCDEVTRKLKGVIDIYRTTQRDVPIVGYGAAAKGMTLLNYSKIKLDWIVDDNELKQNKFTPGMSIPILSSDSIKNNKSPIVFVPLAWNFFGEIKSKIKEMRPQMDDTFITYFPEVKMSK